MNKMSIITEKEKKAYKSIPLKENFTHSAPLKEKQFLVEILLLITKKEQSATY